MLQGFASVAAVTASLLSVVYFASFYSPLAANILYKIYLATEGFAIFVLSRDKSWKQLPDPDLIKGQGGPSKRIIFIRHGESEWNEVFNKGFGPSFIVRLIKAILKETSMVITRDSVFIDSSLSDEGIEQAKALRRFIAAPVDTAKDSALIGLLKGDASAKSSIVVTSNLRRAIETGAIALSQRLSSTQEKVYVLSCLQEVSRNVDANALAVPKALPDLHMLKQHVPQPWEPSLKTYDVAFNYGQKSLTSNGLQRMLQFCDWAFTRDEDTIIVGSGHSLWFRAFFKTFLPHSVPHISKTKKMVNCGVIAFTLTKGKVQGSDHYRIEPSSVSSVYGGFQK